MSRVVGHTEQFEAMFKHSQTLCLHVSISVSLSLCLFSFVSFMVSIEVYCKHLLSVSSTRLFKWLGNGHKGLELRWRFHNQEEKRRRNVKTLTDEVKAEASTST